MSTELTLEALLEDLKALGPWGADVAKKTWQAHQDKKSGDTLAAINFEQYVQAARNKLMAQVPSTASSAGVSTEDIVEALGKLLIRLI